MRHLLGLLLVGLLQSAACARADRDSITLRNDCKRVEQIFKAGRPAAQLLWAGGKASDCGPSGMQNGAALIDRLASSADPGEKDAALYLTAQAQSKELFEAALRLASEQGDTDRTILGLTLTMRQLFPHLGWTVERLRNSTAGRRCATGYIARR